MRTFELVYLIFYFLLLCCFLSLPYWAYRSYQELKKMNEKLDRLTARIARDE
jgi:hypothetical protein